MIRKTIFLGFLSFACVEFCAAEITEYKLSDGTIVKRMTTQIAPANSNAGNMPDAPGNYSFRNGGGPVIYLNPPAGYVPDAGSPADSGSIPNNGYVASPPHLPYAAPMPVPGMDSGR